MSQALALHPDDVEFVEGETYFVKLKRGHSIEPIWCHGVSDSVKPYTEGQISSYNYATKEDIEYVVGGIPIETLVAANQARVFGRRRVAGVEEGRGDIAPVSQPSVG